MTFCLCYWFFWVTIKELINFWIFLYICVVRIAAHSSAIGINLCKHLEETSTYYIFYTFVYENSLRLNDILQRGKKIISIHVSDLLGGHRTLRGLLLHTCKFPLPVPGRQWFSTCGLQQLPAGSRADLFSINVY